MLASPPKVGAATLRVELEEGMVAALTQDHQLYLEALPERGEGLLAFARRLCGDAEKAKEIAAANDQLRRLLSGVRYRVPFEHLRPEYQLVVAESIFSQDGAEVDGWRHEVRGEGVLQGESLWRIAEWFTGRGEDYRAIRDRNGLIEDDIYPGQSLLIPAELLRPAFRAVLPRRPPRPEYELEYGRDNIGEYALYALRSGEALYSSVVVRFTGRMHADDVNALAAEIAQRSNISDVTEIPVGYKVKIAFDLLQPEFLPPDHPKRREYEANLDATAQFSNPVRARDLKGITVILDAGHGGSDVGASRGGVWESVYVYDIMLRAKRILETSTAAEVVPTTRDGKRFEIEDRDVLRFSREHAVLTTPPYAIVDSTIGVHLRWYLSNSVFSHTIQRQKDPEKIVFISIHADSLHPSLRGAMVYIPGKVTSMQSYGRSGAAYASRKEYKEQPRVTFSKHEQVKSEGLSRDLAEHLIRSFASQSLAVHPYKPVRGKVIRGRREWVPAVLRYNSVPSKVLLEVCNLANTQDRKLIQTRSFRQQVAEAMVQGILSYYGYSTEPPEPQVARAR